MHASEPARFVIIGGGLGGALAACYFGRAGHEVHLYEMRDDPRTQALAAGRSINLAISHRGIEALRRVGLADRVLDMAVPMPGRMIHPVQGPLHFQPYARDPSMAINSVSRNGLNELLLRATGEHPNVTLHFNHKCIDVDVHDAVVELVDTKTDKPVRAVGDVIVSADGAFSAVRRAMHKLDRFDYSQNYLAHGYKELSIPAGPDGAFRIERNALHIWPRRALMMIALPNADGSFTCTIFWPFEGPNGFDAIRTKDDLLRYFNEQFPDAVPLMPALADDYFDNPTGALVTIRCGPWYLEDRVVLLGDACHAVVPFYGQGANAAFEDVLVLDECMQRHRPDRRAAFADYYTLRKKSVDTLAELAIHNFIEMRDHTGSRLFLFKKKAANSLSRLFPKWYLPLYTMVTFTRMPYDQAVRRARRQNAAAAAVLLVLLTLFAVMVAWLLR
jgi:kynurenine 3-monooxygenase